MQQSNVLHEMKVKTHFGDELLENCGDNTSSSNAES